MENKKVTWDLAKRIGKMTLANGKTPRLEIDVADDEPLPEETLKSVQFLIANEPTISLEVAASVIENYREWVDDNLATPEALVRKISLTDVTFEDDGHGELYYKAEGNMFTGHSVCAPLYLNGEIGEAEIAG